MSTATCRVAITTTVEETLDEASAPAAAASGRMIRHTQFNRESALMSGVTKGTAGRIAMTAGAATLDLTAVPSPEGTINLLGLAVKLLRLINPSTNANAITIKVGASDGYELAGSSWAVTLQPDEAITIEKTDAPEVDTDAKIIDISGTGTEVLDFVIAAGPPPEVEA